ncbi:2-amino-4-hydroxy-6-hydroxymethyldihydropteridine diphosphokinase [Shewanella sp. NIFS-20-20]|uniref:2-amino-4-hydroxy-6- hydroxymethyldihydropteridine diphosphokinase n=1 Tax=Shewanella sp. NIFS-20-20 TaxID=2853806 RepID=UPI001C45962F|nr:2-amino-4-hydroxy-6-hydroxymethyldihydropteridine diphosphokinase [Shewanella sp. NIFS-20-20]MBV7314279.1 2-amino-4-hydroxy-6-hydroxymethyldihydropteridine diphosphokinase [Shewanella sp. NIFS-20-20]
MASIFISLGSNIQPEHYLWQGLNELAQAFGALTLSSVYESEAVGFDGGNFLNMVVGAETSLPIAEVVSLFKTIERAHGRLATSQKFSSRTLDIDLLLYDDLVCQDPVELPRAEITENAFVLQPLAEIAPTRIHPILGTDYQSLWHAYNKPQRLWTVELDWPPHTAH